MSKGEIMRTTYHVIYNERNEVTLSTLPCVPPPVACARCAKRPAAEGRKSCPVCLDYDRAKAAVRRMEHRKAGLCLVCGEPVTATRKRKGADVPVKHCPDCLAYYRHHNRAG